MIRERGYRQTASQPDARAHAFTCVCVCMSLSLCVCLSACVCACACVLFPRICSWIVEGKERKRTYVSHPHAGCMARQTPLRRKLHPLSNLCIHIC